MASPTFAIARLRDRHALLRPTTLFLHNLLAGRTERSTGRRVKAASSAARSQAVVAFKLQVRRGFSYRWDGMVTSSSRSSPSSLATWCTPRMSSNASVSISGRTREVSGVLAGFSLMIPAEQATRRSAPSLASPDDSNLRGTRQPPLSSARFNYDSQIFAIASKEKKDMIGVVWYMLWLAGRTRLTIAQASSFPPGRDTVPAFQTLPDHTSWVSSAGSVSASPFPITRLKLICRATGHRRMCYCDLAIGGSDLRMHLRRPLLTQSGYARVAEKLVGNSWFGPRGILSRHLYSTRTRSFHLACIAPVSPADQRLAVGFAQCAKSAAALYNTSTLVLWHKLSNGDWATPRIWCPRHCVTQVVHSLRIIPHVTLLIRFIVFEYSTALIDSWGDEWAVDADPNSLINYQCRASIPAAPQPVEAGPPLHKEEHTATTAPLFQHPWRLPPMVIDRPPSTVVEWHFQSHARHLCFRAFWNVFSTMHMSSVVHGSEAFVCPNEKRKQWFTLILGLMEHTQSGCGCTTRQEVYQRFEFCKLLMDA
ncbi:hypothetical protein BKA70DRAFT_1500117 [Coprinopsis sp. MPI-PUGE-AT-0042]|nr:hypothetical protein BKA70DRAFT_1500117 [Coprinopsis sp. MPI-PUGE-AT-0042]